MKTTREKKLISTLKNVKKLLNWWIKDGYIERIGAKDILKEINNALGDTEPETKKQLADKPANARIFKQVLTSPYYENENGTLKTVFNIRNKNGVYMIYHKGELRYIGLASDIYKTMYHHLGKQAWNNSKQYRAIYKDIENVKVRVIYTKTFEIAKRLEAGLIFKYNPPDNYNTYPEFEADDKEREIVNDFLDAKGQPIAQFKGDLPF